MRLSEAMTVYFGGVQRGLIPYSNEMETVLSNAISVATPYEISLLSTTSCEKLYRWASDNRPLIKKDNLDTFCKLRIRNRKSQQVILPVNLSHSWDDDAESAAQVLQSLRTDSSGLSVSS